MDTLNLHEQKNALEELLRNRTRQRDKYRTLFEVSGDALSILDLATGRFVECNQSAIDMHGVKSEENFLDLMPSELSPEYQPCGSRSEDLAIARIQKTFSEGPQVFQWVHRRLDGSTFPCLVSLTALPLTGQDLVLAIGRDISNLVDAQNRLATSIAAKQAMFNAMLDSVIVINQSGVIEDMNPATEALFEYNRSDLLGQNISCLMDRQDAAHHNDHISNYLSTGKANIIGTGREVIGRRKSGALMHLHLSIAEYSDLDELKFVASMRDVTEEVRTRSDLEFDALHDPLTHLPTRRLLDQKLDQFVSEAFRNGASFAIAFIDLNDFKPVNDTLGHDVGDQVLRTIADRLSKSLRQADVCSRVGGDEFVIVTEPSVSPIDTVALKSKLAKIISAPMEIGAHSISVNASIGFSKYPEDGQSKDAILRIADRRMYAKKSEMKQA